MKFRVKDLEKYLITDKIDWQKVANDLNVKSFETSFSEGCLEVEILPNRFSEAACFLGLAEEISLITRAKVKLPKIKVKIKKIPFKFDLEIRTKKCLNYFGKIALNVKNKPSPQWLKELLEFYGFNSINIIVDLANFVMLEYGAPLHIFDLDKISGQKLIVRESKKDEKFLALNKSIYSLPEGALVIADENKILALAGIQGSFNCQVDESTTKIFIEAAVFDNSSIYKTSRQLNLRTQASYRFERGIIVERSQAALDRFLSLLQEYTSADVLPISFKKGKLPLLPHIKVSFERINQISGLDLSSNEIEKIISRLGIKILQKNRNYLVLEPPPKRVDLRIEEDIIEEIVRIFDWGNIKEKLPTIQLESKQDKFLKFQSDVRKFFLKAGFDEVMTYSFINDEDVRIFKSFGLDEKKLIKVLNPTSEVYKFYRPYIFINLLKLVEKNLRHFKKIKIFEIGRCVLENKEERKVGFISSSADQNVDELLKETIGFLKSLFKALSKKIEIRNSYNEICGDVFGEIGNLGFVGLLKQNILFDLKSRVVIGEINLDKLMEVESLPKVYQPPPRYPSIIRDLALIFEKEGQIKEIETGIKKLCGKILSSFEILDIYFLNESKSITYRLTFNAGDRTLEESEVEKVMSEIQNYLSKENIKIR